MEDVSTGALLLTALMIAGFCAVCGGSLYGLVSLVF